MVTDSGASCNLMDYATWFRWKESLAVCESGRCDKGLYAYWKKKPIDVGSFVFEMK